MEHCTYNLLSRVIFFLNKTELYKYEHLNPSSNTFQQHSDTVEPANFAVI